MWCKNCTLSDAELHLFLFQLEKVKVFLDCSRCRRGWGTWSALLQCKDVELLSLLGFFFSRSLQLVLVARMPLLFAVWSTAVWIFKLLPFFITLCFRRYWFTRCCRVTFRCHSFDVLGVLVVFPFWFFTFLSHLGGRVK